MFKLFWEDGDNDGDSGGDSGDWGKDDIDTSDPEPRSNDIIGQTATKK